MSWKKEHLDFGILHVNGRDVTVYKGTNTYDVINVEQNIRKAKWSGGEVVIILEDGRKRKYESPTNYQPL
jgi:hypothetical protein